MSDTAVERRQFLSFSLAGAQYGVAILKLKEILQLEPTTKVPGTPPSVRGIINLRGSVVPVIDLALKFGLSETVATKRTCILMVESVLSGERSVLGILVDAVSEVVGLGPDDIEAPPSFGTRVKLEYLLGMGKVDHQFVLLLDIDRILSSEERQVAVAAEAGSLRLEQGAMTARSSADAS